MSRPSALFRAVALVLLLEPTVARAGPASTKPRRERGRPVLIMAVGSPCMPGATGAACASEEPQYDDSMVDLFGIRAGAARAGSQAPTYGVSLASEGAMYGASHYANVRAAHLAMLGVGPDGVEGALQGDYAFGVRAPVGRYHGPFARVGVRGLLLGNSELYNSLLELPTLTVGYQLLGPRLHLEIAGRGGAVLVGRYNAGGIRRKLGNAPEFGGLAAVRWEDVQLELDLARVAPPSSTPVDSVTGSLCSVAGAFGICLDAHFYRGNVQSSWVGLAVGAALAD